MSPGKILQEPLLHFLLIGTALFVLFGWLNSDKRTAPDEIVVDQAIIDNLVARFTGTWQRPPNADEFDALIESWIREEVLYREGVAMGLDQNDSVVRRRIAQMAELFAESQVPYAATNEELQAWIDQRPEQYQLPVRYSFRQVYFDPSRHGDRLTQVLSSARNQLSVDSNALVGDATMLPAQEQNVDAIQVARLFGQEFADALVNVIPGVWSEPVQSGFGIHLVLITERTDARTPTLNEIRASAERDLLAARVSEARKTFYTQLRQRYTVRIESDQQKAAAQ